MANLVRVRSEWTGSPIVGPGVTTWYFAETATGFLADLNVFWGNVGNRFPVGLTVVTQNTGDLIDIDTGALSGTWTDGVTSSVNTSGTGAYAGGVGARIKWATSGVRNGRRVRGSTFLVPLLAASYAVDGTIDGSILGSLQGFANTLYTNTAGDMRIYSRPSGGQAGQASTVTGVVIPDKVSWLRSRRL